MLTSQEAFRMAIEDGWLSLSAGNTNWVGNYMFMGESAGFPNCLAFKHIDTREYLHIEVNHA